MAAAALADPMVVAHDANDASNEVVMLVHVPTPRQQKVFQMLEWRSPEGFSTLNTEEIRELRRLIVRAVEMGDIEDLLYYYWNRGLLDTRPFEHEEHGLEQAFASLRVELDFALYGSSDVLPARVRDVFRDGYASPPPTRTTRVVVKKRASSSSPSRQ
jgi:hypothetical protein